MKILTVGNMYPPHHLGGYELIWHSWVRHAEAKGHAVRVLTTDFLIPDPVEGRQETGDVHRDFRWYWRDHEFPRASLRQRWSVERYNATVIERHIHDFNPDVVAWWSMAGMSLSPIERVRRMGIPAIGFLGDYWLEYGLSVDAWTRLFLHRPRLARIVAKLTGMITQVDLVTDIRYIFASEIVHAGAKAAWPALTNAQVIPHEPPDVEIFVPTPPPPWSWNLLYVGRIDEVKGVDLALLSLLHLPEEATLTIIGSGNESFLAKLHKLVTEHRLENRVIFDRKRRTELPSVYSAADVVLFPVRWGEPFGLVPLEAMAVGRPVVATGKGGSGEYLRNGVNCLIFAPEDGAAELAERVRRLAADPGLRERLREGGTRTLDGIHAATFNDRLLATAQEAHDTARFPAFSRQRQV